MLELHDICKEYRTGDTVQKALDHVDLTLADTEFVAILGPSGSGKTTLLNIIGGLDRYDSGDLIIDGISTKDYTDRDWDAYRNHAVGFVFQSYNLIMHQSVLSNVELALTIGGVSREERRQRAEEALRLVGLGDHMHKKPNQLSGGQMQRVAIARALVNNPKILLADEPTGALDSETSIQVMNLLKKVAQNRLVVMVTHNPELAEKYATRIVTIKDGQIAGSRDLPQNVPAVVPEGAAAASAAAAAVLAGEKSPASQEAGPSEKDIVKNGRFRHTSMNFLTALGLSFQNLRTKKARTFMVSFAGSIGIIGIALILAIETGLQQYVSSTESATLSQYPIEIYSTGIDWSSLLTESYGTALSMTSVSGSSSDDETAGTDEIVVNTLAKDIFTGMNANDLVSFKQYLESGESDINNYVTDIEYNYGVEPQIYTYEPDGTYEQLNPNRMLSDMLTSIVDVSSLMDGIVGESIFHAMPSDSSIYEESYDVKAGRWPENSHELVLVLTNDGRISDFLLYELGIKDPDELRSMIDKFSSGSDNSILSLAQSAASVVGGTDESTTDESESESVQETDSTDTEAEDDSDDETEVCHYSDFLDRKFKLILGSDTYVYNSDMGVWSDKSDDADYMSQLVANGEDLTIVGIVQAKENASNMMLTSGIGYSRDLIYELIERESESEPVQQQLANPDTDIFTGKKFTDDSSSFDFGSLVTLDHDDVAKAFDVNMDNDSADSLETYLASEIDEITQQIVQYASNEASSATGSISLEDYIDLDALASEIPQLSEEDLSSILNAAFSNLSEEAVKQAIQTIGTQYVNQLKNEAENTASAGIDSEQLEQIFKTLTDYIGQYLSSGEAQQVIREQVESIVNENASQISKDVIQSKLQEEIEAYISWVNAQNSASGSTGTTGTTTGTGESGTQGSGSSQQLNPGDPTVIALYLASQEGQQRINALASSIAQMSVTISEDQLKQISDALIQSFATYASENDIPGLEEFTEQITESLTDSLAEYLTSEDVSETIRQTVTQMIDSDAVREAVSAAVTEKISGLEEDVSQDIIDKVSAAAQAEIEKFAADVSGEAKRLVQAAIEEDYPQIADYINTNIGDFFTVDQEAFRQAIKVTVGVPELQSILTSFLNSDEATLSGNLSTLGYADLDSPTVIIIYPKDFNAKNQIADIIDSYNDDVKSRGEDDKAITYSDVVATMMQSITDIINAISRILVAFVSISLVVSSIMIGVITYISVLERKKEIGILRAMGASKHNVREVFNAETFITGLVSGCLGIGLTFALIPLANMIIQYKTGQAITAVLEPGMAGALILLSVVLTLLAGLIPSGKAARSDPVAALRSE
ncbi:MAG: ATP-binding cassette domain-containing protein [Lachnospiraceae bacterium]|jgi:putative ABC transport system permease protein